jgi:hypothetical protein
MIVKKQVSSMGGDDNWRIRSGLTIVHALQVWIQKISF